MKNEHKHKAHGHDMPMLFGVFLVPSELPVTSISDEIKQQKY